MAHRVSVEELADLLTQAGFAMKTIETHPNLRHQLTAEAAIRFSEASSFGSFPGHLPEELRAPVREDLRRELEQTGVLASISGDRLRIVAIAVRNSSHFEV